MPTTLEVATAMQAIGPKYAEIITRLHGSPWRYEGELMNRHWENHPNTDFVLVHGETGASVCCRFYNEHGKGRVSMTPNTPGMPSGSESPNYSRLSDFAADYYNENGRQPDVIGMDPSVAFTRFIDTAEVCAKRFMAECITPYLTVVWPRIQRRITELTAGYAERDRVVTELVKLGGTVREQRHGGGGEPIVSFRNSLPDLQVNIGGSIRFTHTPTLRLPEVAAMVGALAATRET